MRHPPFNKQLDGQRIQMVLALQNSRRQRIEIVTILHRHWLLQHDRPAVQFRGHEMHRRACPLHAVFPGLVLRVRAGKCRQQ